MALWQIPFFILPEESLRDAPFKNDGEGLFDDAPYWAEKGVNISFFDHVARFLPESTSWSGRLIIFGNDKSHDLQVYLNDHTNKVESASLRIDFTKDYSIIIEHLTLFCIENKLIIISAVDLQPLLLNTSGFVAYIQRSPQVIKYDLLSKP